MSIKFFSFTKNNNLSSTITLKELPPEEPPEGPSGPEPDGPEPSPPLGPFFFILQYRKDFLTYWIISNTIF